MASGNKENLNFNSHTSIAHFNGIEGVNEDKWNKWEYDAVKQVLSVDTLRATDDSESVKKTLFAFFDGKNIPYMLNLYSRNSGDRNSGDRNSGDRNSGYMNSETVMGGICSKPLYSLFNKPCKEEQFEKGLEVISSIDFVLTEWIYSYQMTDEEKTQYPNHAVCDGYLREYDYKEAWKIALGKCSKETIAAIKKIKNYNAKVFTEITGVKI
jgi:hypothetical protein